MIHNVSRVYEELIMVRMRSRREGRSCLRYLLPAVMLGVLLLGAVPSFAQEAPADSTEERIVDLSADFGEGYLLDGEEVRRLVGNVHLTQGNTTLTANEAIQYVGREEYEFTRDVRIVDEGDTLWAERVLYSSRTKIGRATSDVRLTDGDVWLTAPAGDYYVDEKRADFEGGVTMVDSTTTLTSERGRYWLDEKRAEFYENVRLVESASMLEADSVVYFRETEVALANGNVFIEHLGGEEEVEADSTQRILLFGAEAYNDHRQGFSRIMGDPLLIRLEHDTTSAAVDTLIIRAEVLESTRSDSLERLVGIDSVKVWRGTMAAVSDSLISDRFNVEGPEGEETREEIHLFENPSMWYEDLQVTGDSILATGRSGTIDSLFVEGRAFVAQPDSATGRIRQLKGGTLTGMFEGDALREMIVQPNAEVIYFKTNRDGGTDGVQMSGDIVHFWFEDDALKQIRWPGESEGTVYPAGLLPDPFQLDGFRWEPERRPQKAGLLENSGRVLPGTLAAPAYTVVDEE